jgi:exopolysaccharide production protein ExoZ
MSFKYSSPILSIQVLRAVAAMMVVQFHAGKLVQGSWTDSYVFLSESGPAGVDIFFVISGFIMWQTTRDHFHSPLAFLRNRIIRIVPLYWLVTVIYVILWLLGFKISGMSGFDLAEITSSLLFVPFRTAADGTHFPIVYQGWTLDFEFYFYLVFAFGMFFRRSVALPVIIVIIVLVPSVIALPRAGSLEVAGFYGNPIAVEFLFGILVAQAYGMQIKFPGLLAKLFIAVGMFIILLSPEFSELSRVFKWGLPATLLVGGCVLVDRQPSGRANFIARWAAQLGDASYSVYLWHALVVASLPKLFLQLGVAADKTSYGWTYIILANLIVVALGLLSYRCIELPAKRALNSNRKNPVADRKPIEESLAN